MMGRSGKHGSPGKIITTTYYFCRKLSQQLSHSSLVNQAVRSINSPLSFFFCSIIFNILNVKNDGKGKIMLKVSLIDEQLGLPG